MPTRVDDDAATNRRGGDSRGRYRVASLFSGIGGFDLGFERTGFEIAFQCELNDFCQRVLAHHWPTVPKAPDIKELASADIPDADIWVAGFPCQDVSLARMGK